MVSGKRRVIPQRSAKLKADELRACDRLTDRHGLVIAVVLLAAVVIAGLISHARPRGLRRLVDLVVPRGVHLLRSAFFGPLPCAGFLDCFACGFGRWLGSSFSERQPFGCCLRCIRLRPYLPVAICPVGSNWSDPASVLAASGFFCGCGTGFRLVYPREGPASGLKQQGHRLSWPSV